MMNNELVGMIIIIMEDAAKDKQKFESLFYGAETPMVIFKGEEMIVEMFNESYHNIYHQLDLLGKPLFEAVEELKDSQFPEILKNVYKTGVTYVSHEGMAKILNRRNGLIEERYFDTTFTRIFWDEDQTYRILAIPREVTDKVKFRKQLELSLAKLEEEKVFRDFFVSALTHDLRSPLSIIRVSLEILLKKKGNPEEVFKLAKKMTANIERTERMISDLLDVNRIQEGEWPRLHPYPSSLKDIVEDTLAGLDKIYPDKIQTNISVQQTVGNWDRISISRIIDNLLSNAVKYGSHDSKVTVGLSYEGMNYKLTVHNWGNPISSEEQNLIFTKHRRGNFAMESGKKGWGIGLAIVKGLVLAHKGQVKVESSEEKGTTFTVILPNELY